MKEKEILELNITLFFQIFFCRVMCHELQISSIMAIKKL